MTKQQTKIVKIIIIIVFGVKYSLAFDTVSKMAGHKQTISVNRSANGVDAKYQS